MTEHNTEKPTEAAAAPVEAPAAPVPYKPVPPPEHQWQPGQSGNPAGKKPGTLNRSTIYRKLLEASAVKKFQADHEKFFEGAEPELLPKTIAEQIAAVQMVKALTGDSAAAEAVMNNAYGNLAQKTEHSGDLSLTAILSAVRGDPGKGLPQMKGNGECQDKQQPTPPQESKQPPQN